MISHETALALWQRAQRAKIGVAIAVSDADMNYLVQALYAARKASDDRTLDDLHIVKAKGEVWIAKSLQKSP